MFEEIRNASAFVSKVIVRTILVNGALALSMLFAVVFCIQDIDFVLSFPSYPFVAIFLRGTDSTGNTTAVVAIITILLIFAAISFAATASRMTWAFSRDRRLPGWKYYSMVRRPNVATFIFMV